MRNYEDDYEEEHSVNMTFVYMILCMSIVVFLVTALVFWINKPKVGHSSSAKAQDVQIQDESAALSKDVDTVISGSKLTSDQLDIWDLPDTGRDKDIAVNSSKNGTVTNQTTGETVAGASKSDGESENGNALTAKEAEEMKNDKTSVYDMSAKENMKNEEESLDSETEESLDDGNHTQITYADGTQAWVELNPNLERNEYDFTKLVYQNPVMRYYVDGKSASWFGVNLTSAQGDVDFSKLKSAGCDYVMIRVGSRGYSSGEIVMDSNYEKYLEGAKKAGLGIGVYFYSQAINKDEIIDEVDALFAAIEKYPIDYPVVFDMESVEDDMARTDALSATDRTMLANLFLSEVEDAGYKPMLYGDKEWLMTKLDLDSLSKYDVWLSQEGDAPDYPYQFNMWQYTKAGSVKGVEGDVSLSISFKDYSK